MRANTFKNLRAGALAALVAGSAVACNVGAGVAGAQTSGTSIDDVVQVHGVAVA